MIMRPAAALLLALAGAVPAGAQDLRVDLSDHLITINTGFTGDKVVLFGARAADAEVVVVVRGPNRPVAVRRAGRVMGLWMSVESHLFAEAPSFYAVAATGPLDAVAAAETRAVHQIGLDQIRLAPPDAPEPGPGFRDALIRLKVDEGLYRPEPRAITALSPMLFRVTLPFPANVPTGQYLVEALLLRDGRVAAAQTTPLVVEKTGLSARVAAFSRERAPVYALIAVLAAAAAGWLVDRMLRRG